MNEEIKSILPAQIGKNDKFLASLQDQLGAGMSAIGYIMELKLNSGNNDLILTDELLQNLRDATQLFSSVHHAISMKRKFEVNPFITEESKSAALQSPIDDYLFGSEFLNKVKTYQTMKKASDEIKKTTKKKYTPKPGTSRGQNLNFKRAHYRTRMKERKRRPEFEEGPVQERKTTTGRNHPRRSYYQASKSYK
ncbi:uncharacterized protein LOC111691886 [Anoplophora glabripennis]|uniref:uncharacterized protein LOC111691886 n=1 Tax=Anoplophora glabripennis TaxID=217634 RepID=UPI000C788568|nr:uncharacterized protein LOC111691886 [Anoplophora glabripennis]